MALIKGFRVNSANPSKLLINKNLFNLFWFSLLFKAVVATLMPLAFDESYYWTWSHNLQLSYFDHPPMVAWLFYLGQPLEWLGHAVRLPAIFLSHATIYIWLLILKPYFNDKQLFIFLLLAVLSPFLGLGGLIVTPDLPLMFFWSLATYLLLKTEENGSWLNFALLGSTLGLAFCAKYHAALFLPLALFWLYWQRFFTAKHFIKIIFGFAFFLLLASPVIYWNWLNDFISFKFQINHGLGGASWNPKWSGKYLLEQSLIFFPLFLWFSLRKNSALPERAKKLFQIFGWGPLMFFLYSSTKSYVEANWTIIAFPYILALGVAHTKRMHVNHLAVGFWGLISIALITFAVAPPLREKFPELRSSEWDKIRVLKNKVSEITGDHPLYGTTFQNSSQLYYWLKKPVYKLRGMNRFDYFDMRKESLPTKSPYYLFSKRGEKMPEWANNKHQIVERTNISDEYSVNKVTIIE